MYRTKYDIMVEILKLCIQPRKKTEIVYGCNLNSKVIKKHLPPLIETGWIEKENKLYTITETGSKILDALTPVFILLSACST